MSGLRPGEKHGVASECMGCGAVFCGLAAFDAHRTGEFSADFGKDGKGRRCLSAAGMLAAGFERCQVGRWKRPATLRTRARRLAAA